MSKPAVPAIEGLFQHEGDAPCLLGTRCAACGTYYFPPQTSGCRNPACGAGTLEPTTLSREGTLWSYTNAGYQPPEPYIPTETPYKPFAIAAVELPHERLCVLGMVPASVDVSQLRVGMKMRLVIDTLFEDDQRRHLTWKWMPAEL